MVELRKIVALWKRQSAVCGTPGEAAVLVTLVAVEGSSYRLPGAKLLLTQDGQVAGTISGGCLEADVVRRALWLTRGGAAVERYAMSFDDTAEIPFGLGCGGTIDLLFERLSTAEGQALLDAMDRSLLGETLTSVSYLPGGGRSLRRLILNSQGEAIFASAELSPAKIDCGRGLEAGQSYAGRFVERLHPPQRLVIFGAGDDARPVVEIATSQGWTVIVADGRQHLACAERFPAADRVVCLEDGKGVQLAQSDAVILMTHSYEQDRALLAGALAAGARYVGLLGSRHRSSLLISEAAEALGRSVEACCENLYAPIGLDVGGDGPEAIALAIVSEVQAVLHGREGKIARLMPEEVARQVESGGAARYQQTHCALNEPA